MSVKVLFRLCKACKAHHKATGILPQFAFGCQCIYLPLATNQ